jgi:hypothetical protein
MKLTRCLGVIALLLAAAACSSTTSARPPGGSPSSTSPSSASTSSSSPASFQRLAEIHTEGGFIGTPLRLQPPAVVVYSDGTVVLDARKQYTLDATALSALVSTVRQDLNGLPATVNPTRGHPIPDIATTVLGVRTADGSYQTVRANALPQIGKEGGYPPPLYDAYTKLDALNATAGTPFTAPNVRYLLSCPAASTAPQPWPAGLPQPTNAEGSNCTETHVVDGKVADTVRTACLAYLPGDLQVKPAVPYQSDKGVRTCQWRYALSDETS